MKLRLFHPLIPAYRNWQGERFARRIAVLKRQEKMPELRKAYVEQILAFTDPLAAGHLRERFDKATCLIDWLETRKVAFRQDNGFSLKIDVNPSSTSLFQYDGDRMVLWLRSPCFDAKGDGLFVLEALCRACVSVSLVSRQPAAYFRKFNSQEATLVQELVVFIGGQIMMQRLSHYRINLFDPRIALRKLRASLPDIKFELQDFLKAQQLAYIVVDKVSKDIGIKSKLNDSLN